MFLLSSRQDMESKCQNELVLKYHCSGKQSLFFHYWDYLMYIWCNNWQSIIDGVEKICWRIKYNFRNLWVSSCLLELLSVKSLRMTGRNDSAQCRASKSTILFVIEQVFITSHVWNSIGVRLLENTTYEPHEWISFKTNSKMQNFSLESWHFNFFEIKTL